jgi:DNA repair protein RadD
MYGTFLADIRSVNPKNRVVGLTATPYRTGDGPLCGKNKLFQRICYEALTGDLISEGWLCPITNKPAASTIDTSGIKKSGGEFVNADAQRVFDSGDNVNLAVAEILTKCQDRHSILVFSAGVNHAEHIAATIRTATCERVEVVTGETFPMERAAALSDFKSGRLRWLVNCDVLTTGFDAPCIDAICVLRATMSPGLFAQIVGRGLRKHESKTDCLILDFGENIKRHGSLDDPQYGRCSASRGGSIEPSDNNGRGKECPNCGIDVASRSVECPECGFIFPVKHEATADDASQLTGQVPPESWIVQRVSWFRHTKRNDPEAPPTLRIDYEVQPADGETGNLSLKHISEWICIEHEGFARTKAGLWWQARSLSEVPDTVDDALSLLDRGACRMASNLVTTMEGKFYKIKSCEFVDERPEEWDEEVQAEEEFSGVGDDVPF